MKTVVETVAKAGFGPILASLVVQLGGNARPQASHARGFFYGLLKKHAPELHDAPGLRPFSLGVGGTGGQHPYFVRITLLTEPLYAALSPPLYGLVENQITLGGESYHVTALFQEDHSWAGLTTYNRLFQGEASADLSLRFVSPTFFRRQGANYALPEPALVFASLIERWDAFAPAAVPPEVREALTSRVMLRHFELRTRYTEAHERTVGVVGRATYHLPRASDHETRWLSALSRFAFYAPVGAKTTLGFGQVRPFRHAPERSSS